MFVILIKNTSISGCYASIHKWLLLNYFAFFGSVCPNDNVSARVCVCYLILLFMCNHFKAFYILLLPKGLLGIILYSFDIFCVLCHRCASQCVTQ